MKTVELDSLSVQVSDSSGALIWSHSVRGERIACRGYVADGTQDMILAALERAMEQARGELSAFGVSNRVSDVGVAAS
jgi:hypothetical protein